jgi:hypothetical protein
MTEKYRKRLELWALLVAALGTAGVALNVHTWRSLLADPIHIFALMAGVGIAAKAYFSDPKRGPDVA